MMDLFGDIHDRPAVLRPTARWRTLGEEQAVQVADGRLGVHEAFALMLWPDALIDRTNIALDAFEEELRVLRRPTDEEIFSAIRQVILDLNEVDRSHGGAGYETDEREELCACIEHMLQKSGVDVDALADRHGITRHEITDEWRAW